MTFLSYKYIDSQSVRAFDMTLEFVEFQILHKIANLNKYLAAI